MDPEEVTVGDGVPHINYRRGDTRRRSNTSMAHESWGGEWHRQGNRSYRTAIRRVLIKIRIAGYEPEICEDTVFPQYGEIYDLWFFD